MADLRCLGAGGWELLGLYNGSLRGAIVLLALGSAGGTPVGGPVGAGRG